MPARGPAWVAIADAHADFHSAIVAAGASERIARAHRALGAETQLFLMQLRPHWTLERMATDHLELPDAIERRGTDALRDHIAESKEAVTGGRE